MAEMARSVGASGQFNQQSAMMRRPDSHGDLAKVAVPTLVMCGREDPVTPVADHQAIAARVPGSRLEFIENCGHLSTIEQPDAVNRVLADWLDSTVPA
jgi:pimeloyl-ACP methyl ester carboxylesterase